MNYVFFGTPRFAAIVLERLVESGLVPSLVVTNPNRPVGRKHVITPPPAKLIAQKHGIRVYQPESSDMGHWRLEVNGAQFAVLASYGRILPKEAIDAFPKGIIVVHPSLLPRYRGATPIQSAILNGDEMTGTTLILMDEKVDHGPVIAERELASPISGARSSELHDELAELSAKLLIEILPKYLSGEAEPLPQDETLATYTKKLSVEDAFIPEADLLKARNEGGEAAVEIDRKIRALNPEPGVWTRLNGKRTKLLEADIADGKLRLKVIQTEGKRPIEL